MKCTRRSWAGVGVLCLLAMGILSLVNANDGDIVWEGKGPGGGGSNLGVAVDPTDPLKVLMGSDTGGIYRSADGGVTWENTNVGAITDPHAAKNHYFVESIAYDPINTQRAYAGSLRGVLNSTDGGASWTQALGTVGSAAVVAVNPNYPQHVYAASGSIFGPGNAWGFQNAIPGISGCVFISHDSFATLGNSVRFDGGSQDCLNEVSQDHPNVRSILVDPTPGVPWDATKILLSTHRGLYRSLDGGQTWSLLSNTGLPHQNCGQLAVDASGVLYLAMLTDIAGPNGVDGYRNPDSWQGGVYKSAGTGTNWGSSWEKANGTDGTNFLPNGDFEMGGLPAANWSYLNSDGTMVYRDGPPPSGPYNLAITTTDKNHSQTGVTSDIFQVVPGARYRISAFAKATQSLSTIPTDGASSFFGRIYYLRDLAGNQVDAHRCATWQWTNLWASAEGNFDWRRYETEILVPDEASYAKIDLYTHHTQGTTWINDVTMRRSNSLPTLDSFNGFGFMSYRALAADPDVAAAGTLYVGTDTANQSYNPDGVWKTVDGGSTWTHETRFLYHDNVIDKRANTDPIDPLDPHDKGGCGFGYGYGRVYGLGIGKGTEGHDTLFMTNAFWSYKKAHGSPTWEETTHDAIPSGQRTYWKGRGVTNDVVTHDVKALGPMVFYGDQDNLLLISHDSGGTYRQEGIDRNSHLWATPQYQLYGGTVSSIVAQDQNHAYAAVENGGQGSGVISGCYECSQSGKWDWVREGGVPGVPGALPEGGQLRLGQMDGILYGAMEGSSRGIYRKDSGWTNIGAPGVGVLPSTFIPSQVAVDDVKNRLYVGLRNDLFCQPPCQDQAPCNSGACLFVAINPASGTPTWCPMTHNGMACLNNAPCGAPISSLRVGASNELYVGTTRSLSSPGGLYKATASGCNSPSGSCSQCTWTWSRILDEPSVTGIAVSPLNPNILYAASAQENAAVAIQEAGIWKSVDGGLNWEHLDHNGLGSLKTPILDYSADGGTLTIWAATEGSGIFKGTIKVPATPAGLTAVAVAGRKINLSWQDLSRAEVGWSVERKKGTTGNWSEVFHQDGRNKTDYTSTNLTAGSTYYFRVRAYDEAGNSAYSNEASATAF